MTPDFLLALGAMAATSFSCRFGGFFLMRYVRITGRIEAAMRAMPLGVMLGIVAPNAMRGQTPELLGIAVILVAMKLTRNDVTAAVLGVATVAVGRYLIGG